MAHSIDMNPRAKKRVYWFSYHAAPWEAKAQYRKGPRDYSDFIHQVRDGAAFAEVLSILLNSGYEYGGLLLNLPREGFPKGSFSKPEALPPFSSRDLIVMVTRPPLSDSPRKQRVRSIERSDIPLEKTIFKVIRKYFFSYCSRFRVTLTRGLQNTMSLLPAEQRVWKDVIFQQKGSAHFHERWVKKQNLKRNSKGHTAGYLLYFPHLSYDGPALLVVFGLSGSSTLQWANAIRQHFSPLLRTILNGRQGRIILARLELAKIPTRPTSLERCCSTATLPKLVLKLRVEREVNANGER